MINWTYEGEAPKLERPHLAMTMYFEPFKGSKNR